MSTTKTNLTTGLPYRFYVVAENIIGKSVASEVSTVYACTSPSGLERPRRGLITTTSVELFWQSPSDDGGCLLTSYSILRNDGNNGEYVEVHAAEVNNNPALKTFTVTDLPVNSIGKTIKFKVKAYNRAGYHFTSFSLSIILASVPTKPTTAPASDFSVTAQQLIKVVYQAPPFNGGSPIINYEI